MLKGKWDNAEKLEHALEPCDNPNDTYWINRGIEDYETGRWKEGVSGCI